MYCTLAVGTSAVAIDTCLQCSSPPSAVTIDTCLQCSFPPSAPGNGISTRQGHCAQGSHLPSHTPGRQGQRQQSGDYGCWVQSGHRLSTFPWVSGWASCCRCSIRRGFWIGYSQG